MEEIDPVQQLREHGFPQPELGDVWRIPDGVPVVGLPLDMSPSQLQSMVLCVWREFMLHDEVLSAISFLENAPYRVRDSAETLHALRITRESISWMDSRTKSDSVNTPMDPNGLPLDKEVTNPLPEPLSGQVFGRFNWITDRIQKNDSVIDFGCIDGTMTNRWGLLGHRVVGIDLSTNSVRIANERAFQFNTGAVHINCYFKDAPNKVVRNSFDAATCSDVYEHLKDPVNDLLIPARECLVGNGKMMLVTPRGSWMCGNYVPWAHPWVWIDEEKDVGAWLEPKPRGHLVAPSIWSVAEHFRQAGWWVKTSEVVLQINPDVSGQGNICVEAYKTPPPTYPRHTVSIVSQNPEPECSDMANKLALVGYEVRYFSSWAREGIQNFVDCIDLTKINGYDLDKVYVETETLRTIKGSWLYRRELEIRQFDKSDSGLVLDQ